MAGTLLTLLGSGVALALSFPALPVLQGALLAALFWSLLGWGLRRRAHEPRETLSYRAARIHLEVVERLHAEMVLGNEPNFRQTRSDGRMVAHLVVEGVGSVHGDDPEPADEAVEALLHVGSVVVQNSAPWAGVNPPWPHEGARRWLLAAPRRRWREVGPDRLTVERTLHFTVVAPSGAGGIESPFPLGVSATLVAGSGRRQLSLEVTTTTSAPPALALRELLIWLPPGLPTPRIGNGQAARRGAGGLRVTGIEPDRAGTARLLLQWEEPLPTVPALWLTGRLRAEAPQSLSGVTLAGYYDRLGAARPLPSHRLKSIIAATFRVDLGRLESEVSAHWSARVRLVQTVDEERLRLLLEEASELGRVTEVAEGPGAPSPAYCGRWPDAHLPLNPARYRITLDASGARTFVGIEVRCRAASREQARTRAAESGHRIAALLGARVEEEQLT